MSNIRQIARKAVVVLDAIGTGVLIGVLDAPVHNPLEDQAEGTCPPM